MNRTTLGLMAALVLLSTPALADPSGRRTHGAAPVGGGYGHFEGHRGRHHAEEVRWRFGMAPRPVVVVPVFRAPPPAGRYESRPVQQWVEGQYAAVWVPPSCSASARGRVCTPGMTQSVWQPGHYETRTEQVWVPANTGHFGAYGESAAYGGSSAVGVAASVDATCDHR